MTAKMLVLYVKRTRHVVSALTVAAMPATPLTIDVLIKDSLKLRCDPTNFDPMDFDMPASELDVAVAALKEEALIDPFRFSIGADLELQTLTGQPTFDKTAFPTITLNEPGVVKTPNLDALVMEQSGADPPQTQARKTTAGGAATFQAILTSGTMLGFMTGYRVQVTHYP